MHVNVKKIQRGPTSKLIFSIVNNGNSLGSVTDPINIDDLAFVKFKFLPVNDQFKVQPFVTIKTRSINTSVEMKIHCENFSLRTNCPDHWSEYTSMGHKLFIVFINNQTITCSYILEVNITVQTIEACIDLTENKTLYNLTDSADFFLRTVHGAVAVHKSVLVPHSKLFEAILTDDSEETDGHFSVEGVTVQTLQQLKDYMYLNVLPDEGLQALLLAATYCLMDKLKTECIVKLAETVSPENLDSLIDFAMVHQIPDLVRALLHHTPDESVNRAHEIRKLREAS